MIKPKRKRRPKFAIPTIKLFPLDNRFIFYQSAMLILDIDTEKQALMFYLNKKEKSIKVIVEEIDVDNFRLYRVNTKWMYSYRFGSRFLSDWVIKTFDLDFEESHLFTLEKIKDKEYKIIYKNILNK